MNNSDTAMIAASFVLMVVGGLMMLGSLSGLVYSLMMKEEL